MSLEFPAKPTKEEIYAHEKKALLAGRFSDLNGPEAKWCREATNVLLNAMSEMSIGQARIVLSTASKRLEEQSRKVASASPVGNLSRPWPQPDVISDDQ